MQCLCDGDHFAERVDHAAAFLPHMDCDGNAGIFKRLKRFDERFGRIEAVRRVAEAQRNAERACSKLLLDQAVDLSHLGRVKLGRAEACRAGADGAAARQHGGVDGAGGLFCSAQIGSEAGKIGVLRQRARNRGQICLDLFFVCTGARRDGQAAVAVDDRGQALLELQLAEMRAEERRVGMAVNVDKAGRNILPCCVKDCPGRSILEITNCGDFSVFNRNIACGRRCAGPVDQSTVLNQIIEHFSVSFV